MKHVIVFVALVSLAGASANASIGCTPVRGGPPCPLDQAAVARNAEAQRKFNEEQRRKQEMIRQQQIIQQQQRQADQARRQREINAYYQQQQQQAQQRQAQQQQLQQQQRARENAEVSNPGAVRVHSYADNTNRARYTAYNNTNVPLNVYISYSIRGADGSYQNGTERATVQARGSHDWPYWMGSVSTSAKWNLQNTNIRWDRAN